jgi:hypothetical protein
VPATGVETKPVNPMPATQVLPSTAPKTPTQAPAQVDPVQTSPAPAAQEAVPERERPEKEEMEELEE